MARVTQQSPSFVYLGSASKVVDSVSHSNLTRPLFFSFSRSRPARSFHFPPHQHTQFEILLIIRGPYDCILNGEKLQLAKNSILIVEPGDWHEDFCRPPLEYAALRFSLLGRSGGGEDMKFFLKETPTSQRFTACKASVFLPILKKISEEAKTHDQVSAKIQDTLAEEFFWRLVRAFDPGILASWLVPLRSGEQFLMRLSRCLENNVHRRLSAPQIARALGVSQRTLSLRCATLLGDSPARAFLRVKIERARQLLAETEMSVKEVSYRLDFVNPYHFSRAYKLVIGHPPSMEKKCFPFNVPKKTGLGRSGHFRGSKKIL